METASLLRSEIPRGKDLPQSQGFVTAGGLGPGSSSGQHSPEENQVLTAVPHVLLSP